MQKRKKIGDFFKLLLKVMVNKCFDYIETSNIKR